MTNVSKQPLDIKTKQKLFKQFATLFAMTSEQKMGSLFVELFTEAEQIMFVKRAGIIIMLTEEYSNYAIAKTLEVSEATVRSTKQKFLAGEYNQLVGMTRKNTFDHEKFWSVVGVVLRGGLPPRSGPGRWKFVFNQK